jgi:hypothetical protein
VKNGHIAAIIQWTLGLCRGSGGPDYLRGLASEQVGPALARGALAVSRAHPLTARGWASAEDLADYETAWAPPGVLFDAINPPRTPSGRPVRRTRAVRGLHETLALVASSQVVHPIVAGLPLAQRSGITLLPPRRPPPADALPDLVHRP